MIPSNRPVRPAAGCFLLGLGLALHAASALGQPVLLPPPPSALSTAQALDPPGRVARLADVAGQVWLYSPDAGEWIGATRNQPLTSGDRLATDAGSRAELRVGSTTLRLDGGAELEVARLDDEHVALRLHAGSLAVRLRSAEAVREFELATSEGRFTARRPGRYRIDRAPADRRGGGFGDSSSLTVYEGEGAYEGPGSALTVYPNQRADFRLDAGGQSAQYAITEALADDFARWSGDRDRGDDRAATTFASRYVSPEMTGAEDLDRNGRWEQDAEYGALWIPRVVPSGWAPYAAGRWTWVRPWGWTWVDDAPWGFAPFHYGRWLYRGNTWCWAPGSYVQRPVYAPALVAWVGGGRPEHRPGDRLGDRSPRDGRRPEPSIGWFPLAPREAFVPGYRASARYARDVNGGHFGRHGTDDRRDPRPSGGGPDFRNRDVPNALTVLPEAVLLQRQPGGVPAAPWRQAGGGRHDDDARPGRGRGDGPAAGLNAIVAPPAPLPLTTPGSAARRVEPGRPAWPRPGMADADEPRDDARRRAAPGDRLQQALPQQQVQQQPFPQQPFPQPAAAVGRPGSPAAGPVSPVAPPTGVLAVPPATGVVPAPVSNGGLLPGRNRRGDDAVAAPPLPSMVPAAPAVAMPPVGTATPTRPVLPADVSRDGVFRRDPARDEVRLERRDVPGQDSQRDRRGVDWPMRRDDRHDGDAPMRHDDRRLAPGFGGTASPATLPPPVAARPAQAPQAPIAPLAAPAAPAAPVTPAARAIPAAPAAPTLQAPPQVPQPQPQLAQPTPGPAPALAPPPRVLREAARPAPPAATPLPAMPAMPVAPAVAPREAPAAPRAAPPAGDDLRRAQPVNRPSPDERRGPPGAVQRDQQR